MKTTAKATEWLRNRTAARVAMLEAFAAEHDVGKMTHRQIAKATGLSLHTVSRWLPRRTGYDRATPWNIVRAVVFALAAFGLLAGESRAGFVTIDEFTNATQSDGLGLRSFVGDVKVEDDAASLIGGVAWLGEVATISYDFTPAPLVVRPKFVLRLKNNQTTYAESGILRASINGGPTLERELFAAREDYETAVFDFIGLVPSSETIGEFRLDWLRSDVATGARELLIDSIIVSDVPEPRSLALVGTAAGVIAILGRRSRGKKK